MKNKLLITTLSILSFGIINLQAQTTMCYKENHTSMSTIETISLNGGKCENKKSVQQMKKDGWEVDDIEITKTTKGKNYIYIFKKDIQQNINEEALMAKVLAKIEAGKKEKFKADKEKYRLASLAGGKKLYIAKCQNCHGAKAELEPMNTSRALKGLSLIDFESALEGYDRGDYDRGTAIIMRPYAVGINDTDIKNIYFYLKTLK